MCLVRINSTSAALSPRARKKKTFFAAAIYAVSWAIHIHFSLTNNLYYKKTFASTQKDILSSAGCSTLYWGIKHLSVWGSAKKRKEKKRQKEMVLPESLQWHINFRSISAQVFSINFIFSFLDLQARFQHTHVLAWFFNIILNWFIYLDFNSIYLYFSSDAFCKLLF